MQLVALDTAQTIEDMNIAGFRLHPLKGEEKGRWSIWVNGNWRLTFEFRDGHYAKRRSAPRSLVWASD
jgi:proteic killer suppression protein